MVTPAGGGIVVVMAGTVVLMAGVLMAGVVEVAGSRGFKIELNPWDYLI